MAESQLGNEPVSTAKQHSKVLSSIYQNYFSGVNFNVKDQKVDKS